MVVVDGDLAGVVGERFAAQVAAATLVAVERPPVLRVQAVLAEPHAGAGRFPVLCLPAAAVRVGLRLVRCMPAGIVHADLLRVSCRPAALALAVPLCLAR